MSFLFTLMTKKMQKNAECNIPFLEKQMHENQIVK